LNTATELLQKVGVDDTSIYMEFFSGDRQTLLEYQAEVALATDIAEEIAEEIADSAEDYFESQPAAFGLYEPGYDADGTLQASGLPLEISDPEAPGSDTAVESPGMEPEAGSPDASTFNTVGTGSLTMSFMRTGINVRIDPTEHILEAAQRAGVRIGANCKEGMCGSCKVVKLSGDVEMNHQGGIRAREISAGKFLPCCSTAQTDLVIDA
jgi:glycine betaine catabolism B